MDKEKRINSIFSLLGNFEDCEVSGDIEPFRTQCYRMYVFMLGVYKSEKEDKYLEISNILLGLSDAENINHKRVKSLIFHCISLINR